MPGGGAGAVRPREVVVEAPAGTAGVAADWLRGAMADGLAPLVVPVPVEVDVTVGRTWGG